MSDAFDQFRRKLADAVTIAINSGVKVSAKNKTYRCPLGCLPQALTRRPGLQAPELAGDPDAADAFIAAFDDGEVIRECPEYAALGLAYRSRFP